MATYGFPSNSVTSPVGLTAGVRLIHSKWVEIDTAPTDKGGRETIYQYADGLPIDSPVLRIGVYPNPKANLGRGQVNVSVKLTVPCVLRDEEDAEIVRDPATFTLAWSVPGTEGAVDMTNMWTYLFTLLDMVGPIDNNEFSHARLTALAFGISKIAPIVWVDPTP